MITPQEETVVWRLAKGDCCKEASHAKFLNVYISSVEGGLRHLQVLGEVPLMLYLVRAQSEGIVDLPDHISPQLQPITASVSAALRLLGGPSIAGVHCNVADVQLAMAVNDLTQEW